MTQIASHDARALLEAATEIAKEPLLSQRRELLLRALGELIGADAGHWAWGRGVPNTSTVTPVAIIDFGYTDEQRALLFRLGLDSEMDEIFRPRIVARFNADSQATVICEDVFSAEEYAATRMRGYLQQMPMQSWIHTVRYATVDTWSNMFLVRRAGEFDKRDVALLDLAMAGIDWLHASSNSDEERLPPETFAGLTPRQRTVMLMLLDGLSRKQIAARLDISEHTVSDHVKSLYQHYGVHSSTELAAKFLRNE
jgi:DNA-binding CsgD family transcriptional regulator